MIRLVLEVSAQTSIAYFKGVTTRVFAVNAACVGCTLATVVRAGETDGRVAGLVVEFEIATGALTLLGHVSVR